LVLNYYRAFTDFIINFTFGKGVSFRSPKETEAIVPDLLERVWEVDNNKATVLWEIGQQGTVSGDCFIKVAYEEAWRDPAGRNHPGRVRILPLNSSFAFPEFHPHDRERLVRFKLKYRFWGTSLEGTRQVFTYTEILTDDVIEEYINDELIDSRPNPLGTIPVIHIPNVRISGSPWGLSDCNDLININRAYNEVATDIADIVNYHAAPVTVITGAKASQLEKGANKVWSLPKDAVIQNLEGGAEGLKGAMELLAMLKKAMHEMIGVPETALGQATPISNTSGVALSIQFQPLMNRYHQKIIQYAHGLERVNELILLSLALKEPETFIWDESTSTVPLRPGQVAQLDVNDPITFRSNVVFPQPLPLDKLIALNEIQTKLSLGFESKEGALRALGEAFPAEKLTEIRQELQDDAMADGALKLIQTQIEQDILALTGSLPTSAGPGGAPAGGGGAGGADEMVPPPTKPELLDDATIAAQIGNEAVRSRLVTDAYGTKIPQRRVPEDYEK